MCWRALLVIGATVSVAALGAGGCLTIPGTTEGGPCNDKDICSKGLVCEDKICKAEAALSWVKMRTPATPSLYGVWGWSASDVFAVGSSGTIYRFQGDPETGLDWNDVSANVDQPVKNTLRGIWGRPGEIFAVGESVVLRFDGAIWKKQSVPDPAKPAQQLSSYSLAAVHGSTEAGVWATGYGSAPLLLKHDGSGVWSVQSLSLLFAPSAMAVLGGQVFLVGNAQHVKYWDGGAWATKNLEKTYDLNAIWGAADNDVYAAGESGVLLHYDGVNWKDQGRAKYTGNGMSGASPTDFYVVGEGGGWGEDFRQIEHCSPGCSPQPGPPKLTNKLYAVWTTPDGAWIYAVGEQGTIYRRKR